MIGHFPNEISALVIILGLLEDERRKWQKVCMRAEDIIWIEKISKSLEQEPVNLESLAEELVA